MKVILEYIWLDSDLELRSKTKTMDPKEKWTLDDIPLWNYDGSSTGQATTEDSEIILKPQAMFKCPFRKTGLLIMCDTYDTQNNPLPSNNRYNANIIFNTQLEEEPWYGLEQEFFIELNDDEKHNDKHYCGLGVNHVCRTIMNEHLEACLSAGIHISGMNAEVTDGQWEYQVGPTTGISSGDHLWISRYILMRISEKHNATINFDPKPYKDSNGSGCHTNYSTKGMRIENGLEIINLSIKKLEKKHKEHMEVYGNDNHLRMTGNHETSDFNTFSFGVGSRNVSIRIPNETAKNKCGYLEDRRPSSNMDPYLVTSKIFKTTILD